MKLVLDSTPNRNLKSQVCRVVWKREMFLGGKVGCGTELRAPEDPTLARVPVDPGRAEEVDLLAGRTLARVFVCLRRCVSKVMLTSAACE